MTQAAMSASLAHFLDATRSLPAETTNTTENNNQDTQPSEPEAQQPAPYGYYNTFHSRAQPLLDSPPSYEKALLAKPRDLPPHSESLPAYSSSVHLEAVIGFKKELISPFARARKNEWRDVYVILCGTSLCIHQIRRSRMFSKDKTARPGELLKQYTLQHAELGIATDFKKVEPVPKHYLSHIIPQLSRQKVYETDPHFFEPPREHVFRVRSEGEQFLLCATSHVELLDWVEALCMAVDISAPLEDRAEPRYRSLPRRNRRQRALESQITDNIEQLNELSEGRRFLEEQERLLQTLYPHLAHRSAETEAGQAETTPLTTTQNSDPDSEDLDPADVRSPTPTSPTELSISAPHDRRHSTDVLDTTLLPPPSPTQPQNASAINLLSTSTDTTDDTSRRASTSSQSSSTSTEASNTTDSPRKPVPRNRPSQSHILRYRRRCAPILLADSPRSSDVIVWCGMRMRISTTKEDYIPFEQLPPRYESHRFPLAAELIPLPPVQETIDDSTPDTDNDDNGVEPVVGNSNEEPATSRRPALEHRNTSAFSISQDSIASSSTPATPTTELDMQLRLAPMDTRDTIESVSPKDPRAETKERGGQEQREGVRKMRLLGGMRVGSKKAGKEKKRQGKERMRERHALDGDVNDNVIWAWGG